MSSDTNPRHDDAGEEQLDDYETAADPDAPKQNTGEWERAPQDFESDVDPTPITVPDYPVIVRPKVQGDVQECKARLVTQGEMEEFAEAAPDDSEEATEFGVEAIVTLLNEKYIDPDFDLTVADYRDSPAGYYDEFFNQIVPEMGN